MIPVGDGRGRCAACGELSSFDEAQSAAIKFEYEVVLEFNYRFLHVYFRYIVYLWYMYYFIFQYYR